MKPASFILKVSSLATLLLLESFFLTNTLIAFVKTKQYFTPPLDLALMIALFIYLLSITSSLCAGVWDMWEQFFIPSVPIALGIFVATFNINSTYALIMTMFAYALITYDNYISSLVKKQLIKFNPRLILKGSIKTLTFSFSFLAAVLVVLNSPDVPQIDIGKTAGELTEKYVLPSYEKQLDEYAQNNMDQLESLGVSPETYRLAKSTGLLDNIIKSATPNINIKDQVSKQVDEFIEPYKKFVNPLMALLAFGLVGFLGFFAKIAFLLTIDLLFLVAFKIGLLKKASVQVSQDIVSF